MAGAAIDGASIDGPLLVELYGPRAWAPLWTSAKDKDLRPRVASILDQVRKARDEGLDPAWYHPKQIEHLLGASTDAQKAQLDLLLSDAVMHYAAHVRDGAYRPDKRTGDGWVPSSDLDPTKVAEEAARSADPGSYLATFVPTDPIYVRFRDELARHREADSGKGLPPIADGPKLAPGSKSPRVRALRAHLEATGDLRAADPATDPELFDEDVKGALESFQKRHGLPVDGVVTSKTRAALNGGSGSGRARQLEIAMEKFRWLPQDLGQRHVFINIPEQRLHLRDGGRSELEMNVVVGKPTWQTPEFSAEMSEIVFNPPWNVPPKIAREEVLPRIKSDPSYLKRHEMRVRGRGRTIPLIQQAPGPRNPLGRAKFNFPNGYDVYLHDTPNKGPFRAADRRLSHGCVRVADAKGLAAAILAKDSGGGASRQKAALSTFQTRAVALGEKLPVHIVYFTAWPNDEGEIVYRGDVYRRDAKLAARWGKPRQLGKPVPVAPPPVKTDDDEDDDAPPTGQQQAASSAPAGAGAGSRAAIPSQAGAAAPANPAPASAVLANPARPAAAHHPATGLAAQPSAASGPVAPGRSLP
ncbi:MAG: murein L,D-transpeptidase, partial [Alphaproteobacteria bacterium]